jgi:hypothetical protein
VFWTGLGLPHPSIVVSFDACAHILLTLWVFIFYVVVMAMNAHESIMQFMTPLLLLCEMLTSTWDENNYMHFLQPRSTPFVNKLTLYLSKMTFAF